MCHWRILSTNPRRQFLFLMAFVVGISIGFMLTSRTRSLGSQRSPRSDTVLFPAGCGRLDDDWIDSNKIFPRDHLNEITQTDASTNAATSESNLKPVGLPGPVGPNEKVLEIIRNIDQRRHLILVGVMTAQKYLDTRAVAVYRTWSNLLPGHVIFFTSATALTVPELPVVRLPTVDDTYPPQKKSFLMLKYMHDNFLERYEWFMRADDDVYVRGDRLESFLKSVNSSKLLFIGQAGMGNKEEFGQLNLNPDENFCMGGPGIVLSRETLRLVAPNVKHCLKNLYSTHEDVEVGRCVRTFAGIPCTWSYEMQTIFYHNGSGNEAFTGNLKQRDIHRAITLHPVKQYLHFYRLHNYFLSFRMKEILQTNLLLHRDVKTVMENLQMTPGNQLSGEIEELKIDGPVLGNSWEMGKRPSLIKIRPFNDSEVLKWDFIHRAIYSYTHSNPRRKVDAIVAETLDDVVNQIMDLINRFSKQRGRVIDFKDILYAYQRVNPRHGADYILDMLLVYKKYRGRKMTLPVRKHVYVQQSFTELQLHQVSSCSFPNAHAGIVNAGDKRINFILPLSGRWTVFQRFMENFEEVCIKHPKFEVTLTVILFPSTHSDSLLNNATCTNVKLLLNNLMTKYGVKHLEVEERSGSFSRAVALEVGASRFGLDDLLLFVDVDMHFDHFFLHRVCSNTIFGKQIYFPIVFSQYDPFLIPGTNNDETPDNLFNNYEDENGDEMTLNNQLHSRYQINSNLGYWRIFGFGIVSLYLGDLKKVGGLDTNIQGWGQEDVDLYDKVLRSELVAFRAIDPGLVHVFHTIECDEKLSPTQLAMCQGSKASSYASIETLSKMIYNKPELIQSTHVGKVADEDDPGLHR
ncbi:Chondroitin sulfate synthase 1 [Chamberlinius hualienensis]